MSIAATARAMGRSRNTIARTRLARRFAVIVRLLGPACIDGEVMNTRRNRGVRVGRCRRIGTAIRFKDALLESEDSETSNTSLVERLSFTIGQAPAHLDRRSLDAKARSAGTLSFVASRVRRGGIPSSNRRAAA